MPEKSITLPENQAAAQDLLRAVLQELNWGIALCLGPDAKSAYERLCQYAKPKYMRFSAIYAPKPEHTKHIVSSLSGGDRVNWGEFGHRAVVIDWHDTVVLCLSKANVNDELELLYASLVAAGGQK